MVSRLLSVFAVCGKSFLLMMLMAANTCRTRLDFRVWLVADTRTPQIIVLRCAGMSAASHTCTSKPGKLFLSNPRDTLATRHHSASDGPHKAR
jgi:hypothetical protein